VKISLLDEGECWYLGHLGIACSLVAHVRQTLSQIRRVNGRRRGIRRKILSAIPLGSTRSLFGGWKYKSCNASGLPIAADESCKGTSRGDCSYVHGKIGKRRGEAVRGVSQKVEVRPSNANKVRLTAWTIWKGPIWGRNAGEE